MEDIQLQQNWDNFCKYHALGAWHGIWSVYSSTGEIVDSFKCIRSFQTNSDKSAITHQNQYFYPDGKTKTENFGTYKRPKTRALYLDNSFSWGSTTITPGSSFWFETGFSYESRRAGIVAVYDEDGRLQQSVTMLEHLARFADTFPLPLPTTNELSKDWRGALKSITPDLITSPSKPVEWESLENLRENHLILHFLEGISISFPPQIESDKEFIFVVDWLVSAALLYRGIRHFDVSGFTDFTLQTFTLKQ